MLKKIVVSIAVILFISVLVYQSMEVKIRNYDDYRDIDVEVNMRDEKSCDEDNRLVLKEKEKIELLNIINNARLDWYLHNNGHYYLGEDSCTINIRGKSPSVPRYYIYHNVDSKDIYRNKTLIQVQDNMYIFKDEEVIKNINEFLFRVTRGI